MIKVAVQTFWTSKYNYGQILQGYALQQFLLKNGFEAYIIRFDSFLSRLKEKILVCLKGKLWSDYKQGKLRQFDEFKKKNILYSEKYYGTFHSLKKNPPPSNYYIVGSDQVWTYMRNTERRNGYLLRFGDKTIKKIAYAASFGRNELGASEKNDYIVALKDFSFVGVREKSGMEICRKLGVSAYWVIDPVALLTVSDWRKISAHISLDKGKRKNIFLYTLTSSIQNHSISRIIDEFTKNYNLYYANSSETFDSKMNIAPSIEEWISYIDLCDGVVTDSFHCTLFCIIFQKNFVTIKRHNGEKMNNRLISLLERLNLLNRYVDSSSGNIEKLLEEGINWGLVQDELNLWREESIQLLLQELI